MKWNFQRIFLNLLSKREAAVSKEDLENLKPLRLCNRVQCTDSIWYNKYIVRHSFHSSDLFQTKLTFIASKEVQTSLLLRAVHKLCRLKIGDFWPPPPRDLYFDIKPMPGSWYCFWFLLKMVTFWPKFWPSFANTFPMWGKPF